MQTVLAWMTGLGIPTLFTIVAVTVRYLFALNDGVQCLLRSELIKDYRFYTERGTQLSDLEIYDWERKYERYHKMGKNGVMDAYNEEIIKLSQSKVQGL